MIPQDAVQRDPQKSKGRRRVAPKSRGKQQPITTTEATRMREKDATADTTVARDGGEGMTDVGSTAK